MQAAIGDERVLHKNQRARLRDQLAAWDRLSKPAAAVQTMITAESQAEAQIQSSTVPVICSREWSRKLWHMAPGYLILGLPLVRSFEPFASHLPTVIVIVTAGLAFLSWYYAASFTRAGERDWGVSVGAFVATALLPMFLFPADSELPLAAIVILSLGDGAAALGGQAFGSARLPWNDRKTIAGTLAFILCAAPAAAWVLWSNAEPDIWFAQAATCAAVAATAAAVAESIPSRINDNIRVGATGTVALLAMHWIYS